MAELSVYDNDPTLYLFTSLTAGSSHIITATSRIETILKANKIPFKGVDTATDDLARKLYGRRARGKKLPLLVKEGYVIADLEQVEEWNEYDELKEALGVGATPAPVSATAADKKENAGPLSPSEQNLAIRQLGAEAAKVAASKKHVPEKISTTNPLLAQKVNSPAVATPTKGGKPDILSPRSIPLPATPGTPASPSQTAAEKYHIPKLAANKPVHSPPSMHADAANPDLAAPPIATTQLPRRRSIPSPVPLSPSSRSNSGGPVTEFHGSKVEVASDEEIRQIEEEQRIDEVSSSEEEDSEDERERSVGAEEAKAKAEELKRKAEEAKAKAEEARAKAEAAKVKAEGAKGKGGA